MTALLDLLSIETGASEETLRRIIWTGPRRYKVYQIAKRNGGARTIAHPARELKMLQRIFLRQVLDRLAYSEVATAYISGRGISYNASCHLGNRWLMKLDFKEFFHSIIPKDWDRAVRRTPLLGEFSADRSLVHRLLFWGVMPKSPLPICLSIGAPTSPAISNLVCFKLDEWMVAQAERLHITVTRYADDITISGSGFRELLSFETLLKSVLSKNTGAQFVLNEKKRGLYGPGERRMVTGLILTPDGKISIGRERKREISALIHKFSLNAMEEPMVLRTKGLLSFAISAEPAFYESMRKKYGGGLIDTLMAFGPAASFISDEVEF